MNKVIVPEGYAPKLNRHDIQKAIDFIKTVFQSELSTTLDLQRVSAPLFVTEDSGLNDNLTGKERPVSFDVPAVQREAQVVHSLAKWKRMALKDYDFNLYEGLFTDMNAIRRDEDLDNTHSIYVDQWDWERVIAPEDRNLDYLKRTVQTIVDTICNVNHLMKARFPQVRVPLKREVTFINSQELEDLYPDLSPEQREYEFARLHKTIFIIGIGEKLKSGRPHGDRSPDYDDWQLNGDIIFWNDILQQEFEISSMGIRVDSDRLDQQLNLADRNERRKYPFHRMLLNNELPQTIGGGIGQSRLCMLLLGCAHIGEVQASIWDEETKRICREQGIPLL